MSAKSCILRIRSTFDSLCHAQQKVAQFVLENPQEVLSSSISELAKKARVSEATVLRFTRAIGYEGYSHFRIALAEDTATQSLRQGLEKIHEDVNVGDSFEAIFRKVLYSSVDSLSTTMNQVDGKSIEKAANLIYHASTLFLVAVGNSQPIAMDAVHRFLKLGKKTVFFTDPVAAAMFARLLGPNDTVVAISFSGLSVDVIEIVKIAKENSAKIVAITSQDNTPLTDLSDVKIFSYSKETRFRTEAMESRIVQLSIIDALFVSVAMINPQKALREIQSTTNPLPYKVVPKRQRMGGDVQKQHLVPPSTP
ncbi:MurR/RpiR family transcriptional regulator [Atrimonas thermophila]|uniref:MurR/RpiR family transcriptional regulator n=1 Tax=Atrimonas thermophila TaxID=3064161 RepID=UPI00399D5425